MNHHPVPLGQRAHDVLTHVGCTTVAEATGLWRNNLYRAHRGGPEQIVLRTTRDAILRVSGPTPTGIQRRVQALAALGYTLKVIAEASGTHAEGLARMSRKSPAPIRVQPRVMAGIVAAYDELHATVPPRTRETTRRRYVAEQRGWLPPSVWDDIDDPNEDPMVGALPAAGTPRTAEQRLAAEEAERAARIEDAWWLAESGEGIENVARRFGLTVDGLARFLKYHDEHDLLAALRRDAQAGAA